MKYKQHPPYAMQISPTEGCNLYCEFCGLQGIRTKEKKQYKYMTLKTAERIAQETKRLNWNCRIEFAMHGEPTMNPAIVPIVAIFRHYLPRHTLTLLSNGGGLVGKGNRVADLMDAGLNKLMVEDYSGVKLADKIRNQQKGSPYEQFEYPRDKDDIQPHGRVHHDRKIIIYQQDIVEANTGQHNYLSNHTGAAYPLDFCQDGKRCAKPFREISIRWNGKIAICCEDWRGRYKCGDINQEPLDAIWHGNAFDSARKYMMLGDRRSIGVCGGCTARSYRVGLLPDPKGLVTMPRPTKRDKGICEQAMSGLSYTKAIKREWE